MIAMSRSDVHLPDETTLLTAIPAMLGFIPERSVILVALGAERGVVRATIRHDLDLDETGAVTAEQIAVLDSLGRIIAGYGVDTVLVVLADDRYPPADERYRRVLSVADRCLAPAGGARRGYVVGGDYQSGAPWRLIWSGRGHRHRSAGVPDRVGVLADPHTSPTALAEAVATGRRLLTRRSQMAAMLEPSAHCAGPCTRDDEWPGGSAARPDDSDAELLRLLVEAVTHPDPDRACATVRRLERAITTIPVRDAALAFAVTDHRHAAEDLWRDLTRRLDGEGRASAATLLAHLHYIGGEGAYAGVALDCALTAAPDWTLAGLLDQALRGGMPPVELRSMIDKSYVIARRLGVTIPLVTLRAAG
ncbi:DUF4192 domain-containing protein [Gordonia sinesedis]